MRSVKVFGERNTGTNALAEFVARNSESILLPGVFSALPGADSSVLAQPIRRERERLIDFAFAEQPPTLQWKHCATYFSDKDIATFKDCTTLILVRNPVSWCLGLWKNPYNRLVDLPESFDEFISLPWKTVARERLDARELCPPDLINLKMSHYKRFVSRGLSAGHVVKVLPFEELVCQPLSVWAKIKTVLHKHKDNPILVENSTKDPSKSLSYYQNYYGAEKWRTEISAKTYRVLEAAIDWNLYGELLK